MDDILYWMWMADVLGPGSPHAGAALAWCGDARNFYAAIRAGHRPAFLHRHMRERAAQLEPGDLQARLDACIAAGAAVLTPDDPDYPRRFLPLSDLPLVLYLTGSSACLNDRRYVAMVGTRRPTPYGQRACRELSRQMAEQGAVIVSGMADGLDGVAQAAAVEAGAPTIAFLGTAIDRTYPAAHAPLRAAIERLGGAVASEYPPGFSGRMQGTFLARNRLIAAMGEVLCVAEAGKRSGTMNTVSHARRYGRPVLAVPGSIFSRASEGTNAILQDGSARMLCGVQDIRQAMGLAPEENLWHNDPEDQATVAAPAAGIALSPAARQVLAVLGPDPQYLEEICRATGLPAHQVLAAYTELELAGAAIPGPGRSLTAAQ